MLPNVGAAFKAELLEFCDLLLCQTEAEGTGILLGLLCIFGSRDQYGALADDPVETDLGRGLVVFGAKLTQLFNQRLNLLNGHICKFAIGGGRVVDVKLALK